RWTSSSPELDRMSLERASHSPAASHLHRGSLVNSSYKPGVPSRRAPGAIETAGRVTSRRGTARGALHEGQQELTYGRNNMNAPCLGAGHRPPLGLRARHISTYRNEALRA